jgi:hypothetical protein
VRFWNELKALPSLAGPMGRSIALRTNRADREGRHVFVQAPAPFNCAFEVRGRTCLLPESAHPSHDSRDWHPSETELPDEGSFYDLVIEENSGEDAATAGLAFVRDWLELPAASAAPRDPLETA